MEEKISPENLKSQEWRLNNLYKIRDKAGRQVTFRMNAAQRHLYENRHYLNVILKARQLGFSTFIDLYILDCCLFGKDIKAGIIAHHVDDAKAIYSEKIKYPYDNLPETLKKYIPAQTDRADEIRFSNGSSIRVSTSFRSGTLQILHVSEYGKIAAKYPEKAREIKTGAFEAVAQGQQIYVESTAEGREGEFYELCERARKLKEQKARLGKLDFRFHFFPWWQNPEYRADNALLTSALLEYFHDLEGRNIKLDQQQKYWYAKKAQILGDDITREHPSFPEEAFAASIEGAYYATQMAYLRKSGRIKSVPYDPLFPVTTYWDLGVRDSMAVWFAQEMGGGENRIIDYYERSGEGLEHFAKVLKERDYNYSQHVMPHDATTRRLGATTRSAKEIAESLGIRPILVAPRPKNQEELLSQIEQTRTFLKTCWIDENKCDHGIKCLDNYRKEWDERLGAYKKSPLHDWASHGADSLRTGAVMYRPRGEYSEADLLPAYYDDF